MIALGLAFGWLVGFSLGLTGGGGGIFAVPLLVYGLHLPSREAVGVSLVTVGATAAVGFAQRLRRRTIEIPTGLLFAVAGMATAPVGAWFSSQMPEAVLLVLFGALMLVIAARMWIKASRLEPSTVCVPLDENAGPTCRRDLQGELHLTSRCALLLAIVGLVVGILTGLFGVGGGFIIVPALVTFSGMGIERAIGTSLLVIALVSMSGIVSQFLAGNTVSAHLVLWFLAGSLGGMFAGTAAGKRLPGRRLQQVFAILIVGVAIFVIARNLWS
jgi:uncharacterized membrane protein YfcA